ncbi:MAG: hypothetical protein DMG25_11545, partial [Acidobacteria bacterium]
IMKRLALPLIALLILTSAGCSGEKTSTIAPSTDQSAATASASAAQAYTGEIMDSSCAMMGGHESMMKQAGAKDAKECTVKCVAAGGKYVLYDAGTKTSYQLDDQSKPKDFAGQKVKVTGTLDSTTNTIHVQNIESA